jgi:hypothetical protein
MCKAPSVAVTWICVVAAAWGLLELLTPTTELTRFRNALLATTGEQDDFNWIPANAPDDFRQETLLPPDVFMEEGRRVRSTTQLTVPTMSELVAHLRNQPKRKGPIKSTTIDAYRQIVDSGRGYCADYTQVFNGLAYASGLSVREWGMSFDRFSGDGHAFNEVFDERAGQWVFIDPMNGFYVRDGADGRPLSALEFRDRLTMHGGFESVEISPIGNTFLFDSGRDAFEYYKAAADQFFLWFGNDVFTYDAHPVVRFLGSVSRPIEQMVAIIWGIHPEIRIVPTQTNQAEIAALQRFAYKIIGLAALLLLTGTMACMQGVALYRQNGLYGSRRGGVPG